MEIIVIEFPAKRYHATPWDAHVNEGRIEWPPSPWRLMRSLLAVGYGKLGWIDGPDAIGESLLEKLSRGEPSYGLPQATEAHCRHYMPTRDKTAKVFDAFLRFAEPDGQLLIRYDVDLDAEERLLFETLVEGLTYLGRAESWVEARVLSPHERDALPHDAHWCQCNQRASNSRVVRLLSALPGDQYDVWRCEQVRVAGDAIEAAEHEKAKAKGKPLTPATLKKARLKAEEPYPNRILDALQLETGVWQAQGWPQPPGSRWVTYHVPESLLQQQPLATHAVTPKSTPPQAVLLAIDGDGKRGTVRPLMKRMLPLMELLHSESIRKAIGELDFGNVRELTGREDEGTVSKGHKHASWLPLSLFGHGRVDHALVHCSSGLSSQAIAALSSIRWAYAKGIDRLSINLVGMGDIAMIARQLAQQPVCAMDALNVLDTSCHWESSTPLVMRKYVHQRGKKTPEGQIREELSQRGYPDPIRVEFLSPTTMVERQLKGYVLTRKPGKQQPPVVASWGVRLQFAEPQSGPIALGYASHFGLGLFRAVSR